MTHDQRNAAIMQMLENHEKTVTSSKTAARKFLIKGGFYTKEGKLAVKYGGKKKPQQQQPA